MKKKQKHAALSKYILPFVLLFAYAGSVWSDADDSSNESGDHDEAEMMPVIISSLLNGTPVTLYRDADADTFGNPNDSILAEPPLSGYVENNLDCDDSDAGTNPNASEIPDSKDNNCDGQIDEGLGSIYYQDADLDGFGNPNISQIATSQPFAYVDNDLDCDDTNAQNFPGAPEIPNDGIDNNCNGLIDE